MTSVLSDNERFNRKTNSQTLSLGNDDSLDFNGSQKIRQDSLKIFTCGHTSQPQVNGDGDGLESSGDIIPNKPFLLWKKRKKRSLEAMLSKGRWQCLTEHFSYNNPKKVLTKNGKIKSLDTTQFYVDLSIFKTNWSKLSHNFRISLKKREQKAKISIDSHREAFPWQG